jgi:hypothetical protein
VRRPQKRNFPSTKTERRWNDSRQAYDAIRAAQPQNWQVRYRLAYLDFVRGEYLPAESGLYKKIVATYKNDPPAQAAQRGLIAPYRHRTPA